MTVLLHLCTPPEWRAALSSGVVAPRSLDEVGFVHLSTADQVELPANRLFACRRDMLLLAVDADLLHGAGVEVRREPGVPGDPESMRFPHAYGAVPTAAVRAVLPYRPDGDGRFTAPDVPELDDAARARLFQPSVLRRAATREVEVAGGVAVLTDPVPASRTHNQLLVDRPVDAGTIAAESDRVLGGAGLPHGAVLVSGSRWPEVGDLRALGWAVEQLATMAAPVACLASTPSSGRVAQATTDELRPLSDALLRADVPGITDDQLDQLCDRVRIEDTVVDVRRLAARESGEVVASCVLKLDGGTAWLDGLQTAPAAQRHGHGANLVRAAAGIAGDAGCDLLALDADARDWPRGWYTRLGFRQVDSALHAVRV